MLLYWIGGDGYNKILTDTTISEDVCTVEQYYMYYNAIVKRSVVLYTVKEEVLVSIATGDEDTLIFPKNAFKEVGSYAVDGTEFKRLVLPRGIELRLRHKALYGNEKLSDFISLSRNVTYADNVFPRSIERRAF